MVNSLARQRRRDKKERGRGESVHRTARSSGGTKSRGDVTRLNTLSLERLPTVCKIEAFYCRPPPRLIHAKFHFPCASRKSKKKSVLPPIQRSIYAATRDPLSLSLPLLPKVGGFRRPENRLFDRPRFYNHGINGGRQRGRWIIPRIRGQAGRPSR